ncbi:MAG: tetratricopeptide repeat protein [Thermoleophilia bacterium]
MSEPTSSSEPAFEQESEAYDLFQRGMRYLEQRHPAQAAMLLRRALRLEPSKNSIREGLAQAEYAMGKHEEAAALFTEMVGAAPDDDYGQYCLGRCLIALGRVEEARAHLRLARALKPGSPLYREQLEALDADR